MKRKVSVCIVVSAMLILGLVEGYFPAAHAFVNGQGATLVIGQSDFTTSAASTTQTGLGGAGTVGDPGGSVGGLAFDASGDLWVADAGNNRILKFVPPFSNGMAASLVIGQSSFTTRDFVTVTQTSLYDPEGITFDASGNMWVADLGNSRVVEFAPPFSNGMAASLVIGQSSFITRVAGGGSTGLFGPGGIALDSLGNLWVADISNNRVLEFVPSFSNGMAASLVIGQTGFGSGIAATTQSGLKTPTSVRFDSNDLWVSDQGNNRTLEFAPPFSSGMDASLVIGQPDFTTSVRASTANSLVGPHSIVFGDGGLWTVEGDVDFHDTPTTCCTAGQGNERVLKFVPPFSNGMAASVVIGQSSFTTSTFGTLGVGPNPTQTTISNPAWAIFDSSGDLWVSDAQNNRVLEFYGPSGPFDFGLGNSGRIVMGQGASANNVLSVPYAGGSGTTQSVTLSVGGVPTGASFSFGGGCVGSPTCTASPSFSSTLTITTTASTPPGTYPITVTGTGGGLVRTTRFILTVQIFDFSLASQDTNVITSPGGTAFNTIVARLVSGAPQTVTLTCSSGLPGGASCSFDPASGTPTFGSVLTITTSLSTPSGRYLVTVTGAGGGQTHTTQFNLSITAGGGLGGQPRPIDKLAVLSPFLVAASVVSVILVAREVIVRRNKLGRAMP